MTFVDLDDTESIIDVDDFPAIVYFIGKARHSSSICKACKRRIRSDELRVKYNPQTARPHFIHTQCISYSSLMLYSVEPISVAFESSVSARCKRSILADIALLPDRSHLHRRDLSPVSIVERAERSPIRTQSRRPLLRITKQTSDLPKLLSKCITSPSDVERTCSICLEDYRRKRKCVRLPCSHEYHYTCISRWLAKDPRCPQDRRDIRRDITDSFDESGTVNIVE
jgi:Ring finger domain